MLEVVFRYPRVRRRICGNPVSSTLQKFVIYLVERGYVPSTTRRYVYAAEHFGHWLGCRPVNADTVQMFITRHLPACRCKAPWTNRRRARTALNHLLEMMGLSIHTPISSSPFDTVLREYADHMKEVQGLAPSTIAHRIHCARDMIISIRIRQVRQLTGLTADQVEEFVARVGSRYAPGTGQLLASSIRAFLRYLLLRKLIRRDLAAAVPRFACWRSASLPATVSAKELKTLVDCVDTTSAIGLRDRAILLCLIELGMRASEVADLELGGIDLAGRIMHLRRRKLRDAVVLPMTTRLATAIGEYVRRGRPSHDTSAALFVQHRAPHGAFGSGAGIQDVVKRRTTQARLSWHGSHRIRHSLASRMINAGASLKQIADLLGHRSVVTTGIYAKVDVASLREVALPWPDREVTP
jgi:integrase/recombinase XerD